MQVISLSGTQTDVTVFGVSELSSPDEAHRQQFSPCVLPTSMTICSGRRKYLPNAAGVFALTLITTNEVFFFCFNTCLFADCFCKHYLAEGPCSLDHSRLAFSRIRLDIALPSECSLFASTVHTDAQLVGGQEECLLGELGSSAHQSKYCRKYSSNDVISEQNTPHRTPFWKQRRVSVKLCGCSLPHTCTFCSFV